MFEHAGVIEKEQRNRYNSTIVLHECVTELES